MRQYLFVVILFFVNTSWAENAFQDSESLQHNTITQSPITTDYVLVPDNNSSLTNFQTTYRMGMGLDMMGKAGLAGVSVQLILTPKFSFSGGFGVAGGFSSSFIDVKRVIRQYKKILAYWGAGLAQWTSESGKIGKALNPGFLRGKFLKPSELSTGKFHHYLVSGSLGFKYLQTSGPLKGGSFYMELSPLLDLNTQSFAPNAGFGLSFYF